MSETFRRIFGRESQAEGAAHGRVNLIGEHTDYSGGFVLPIAVPQKTIVEIATRTDGIVRAWSANRSELGMFEFALGAEERRGEWIDYMQAVTQTAARFGFVLGGYDALVSSEVPLGAGLASSAALNVAHLRALADAFDWNADGVEIARMAQRAENDFVGAPVGIMDPMAAMYATARAALFLDTSTLQFESVPLPEAGELAVLDSGGRHWHAEGGYRDRRREYEQAMELLGMDDLRPFFEKNVEEVVKPLPAPLDRRVRHILSENMRVLRVVEALRAGDLIDVGRALFESHESLRKDYEVSTPDLDRLVEAAMEEPQVYGARLTGGGFGGAVLMLTHRGQGARIAQAVARRCAEALSNPATILLPIGEIV